MNLLRRLATTALPALIHATLALPTAHAGDRFSSIWIPIRDPGNIQDTTGYGAAADLFQIMKYEFTNDQYTDFLNSVAATDTYSLYNTSMGSDANGGITRSGLAGSYSYAVKANMGDKPVNYVTWFDAARVANWMQNGQGSGSTETGAYTLVGGQTSGTAPGRNSGAAFYIPTEDQWYKAAFYSPVLNSGSGGYYAYATQSNTAPGNTIGSAANQANYRLNGFVYSVTQSASYSSGQNYLTDAGAFTNSASYYGTFDQSGNILEWNDLDGLVASGSSRGLRGGSWNNDAFALSSSQRNTIDPSNEFNIVGFRLASPVAVPEPSTWVMGLAGIACGGWQMFRRRRAA
jgi:formylglycine-generating enzyme